MGGGGIGMFVKRRESVKVEFLSEGDVVRSASPPQLSPRTTIRRRHFGRGFRGCETLAEDIREWRTASSSQCI